MIKKFAVLTLVPLLSSGLAYGEDRSVESHEHGHAGLSGVFKDGAGLLELHVPAESIVGFETAPETDAQKKAVEDAEAAIVTAFDSMVLCENTGTEAELEIEGDHAEFHVEAEYTCQETPTEISAAAFFAAFPDLEEIDAELVVNDKAIAGELEADAATLSLK